MRSRFRRSMSGLGRNRALNGLRPGPNQFVERHAGERSQTCGDHVGSRWIPARTEQLRRLRTEGYNRGRTCRHEQRGRVTSPAADGIPERNEQQDVCDDIPECVCRVGERHVMDTLPLRNPCQACPWKADQPDQRDPADPQRDRISTHCVEYVMRLA